MNVSGLRFVALWAAMMVGVAGASCSGGAESSGVDGKTAAGLPLGPWSLPGTPADHANGAAFSPSGISTSGTTASASSGAMLGAGGGGGTGPDVGAGGGGGKTPAEPSCDYPMSLPLHLSLPDAQNLGTPALARGVIESGKLPAPARLRATEFLNFYRVTYDPPPSPGTLTFTVGLSPDLLVPHRYVLQIGVQPPAHVSRPPIALAVVVDTSVSMVGGSIARAQAAGAALASALAPGDAFLLVTSSRHAAAPVSIEGSGDRTRAAKLAGTVAVDGGGDLGGAVNDAYLGVQQMRTGGMPANAIGRVVVVSDGAAQAESLDLAVIAGSRQMRGVTLVGVGVGDPDTYDSTFVDKVAFVGGGASVYVDDAAKAGAVLRDRFDEIMTVVADAVEVEIDLPAEMRAVARSEATQAANPGALEHAGFGPGRALIFRQTIETCHSLDAIAGLTIGVSATWTPPRGAKGPPMTDLGGTVSELLARTPLQLAKASAIATYAEALATQRPALFPGVLTYVDAAVKAGADLQKDTDLKEIHDLATACAQIAAAPANN